MPEETAATPVSVVVQLNRPALDRLLGGDSQLEVELRHQVVEEFARHRLKTLLTDSLFQKFQNTVVAHLEQLIKTQVGEIGWDYNFKAFRPTVQDKVHKVIWEYVTLAAQSSVEKLIPDTVARLQKEAEERVARYELKLMGQVTEKVKALEKELDDKLNKRVDAFFEGRVEAECRRRLAAAASPIHGPSYLRIPQIMPDESEVGGG